MLIFAKDLTQGCRSTSCGLVRLVVAYCVSQARRGRADGSSEETSGSWL